MRRRCVDLLHRRSRDVLTDIGLQRARYDEDLAPPRGAPVLPASARAETPEEGEI